MSEQSYPFDAGSMTEDGWAKIARLWAPSCVEAGTNCLVTAGSGFQTQVAAGAAFVRGFGYNNDSAKTLTHAGAPSTAGQSRIDLIVLHLDRTANTIDARILTGVAAAAPVVPALTQNDASGVWETPLAQVIVAYGASAVGAITDKRNQYDTTDTGWTQTGMTVQTGWSLGALNACAYRKVGRRVDVRISATRTGAALTASATGNIADSPVLMLPAGFWPPSTQQTLWSNNSTSGSMYCSSGSGYCTVADGYPSQSISTGDVISANFSYWLD